MKNIVVIPARGGSKRFPGKNIYPLDGIPLIAHSIRYGQQLDDTDVFVSTDSEEIAKVAEEYGAIVIKRPDEISGDFATTAQALQHAALYVKQQFYKFDNLILLQSTNPCRPKGMLSDALIKMIEGNYDSLMSVSRMDRKLGKIIDGVFTPWNYTFGQRSQDMEPLYYENGLLYISQSSLIEQGIILGKKALPYVVDGIEGTVDIDTKEDFDYAEYVFNRLQQ